MSVEFTDNTVKIMEALADDLSAFMHEVGGEIQSQARRNVRVDTGKTKGSYDYKVNESVMAGVAEVIVGSDAENAIWEEFGTGEFTLNGNGRKGGWTYQDDTGVWHHTRGKSPTQPLKKAFDKTAPKIKKQLANIVKQSVGG